MSILAGSKVVGGMEKTQVLVLSGSLSLNFERSAFDVRKRAEARDGLLFGVKHVYASSRFIYTIKAIFKNLISALPPTRVRGESDSVP